MNFQLIGLHDGVTEFHNNNVEILSRSNFYFDFTPLTGGNPPVVALPPYVEGVYNFSIGEVGPESTTFMDPFIAIGYGYAIGAGDPNFYSVYLPNVGDGLFTNEK